MARGLWYGYRLVGALRWGATIKAKLRPEGRLVLQCSVNDMGPGTATMMTAVVADVLGLPTDKISIKMGSAGLPPDLHKEVQTLLQLLGQQYKKSVRD